MLNNNKAWTWRVSISTIIAVLLFFGGWAFTEMNNIPKEYVSKNQFKEEREMRKEDRKELCERLERMEKRINARFDNLESKLDAIGRKN